MQDTLKSLGVQDNDLNLQRNFADEVKENNFIINNTNKNIVNNNNKGFIQNNKIDKIKAFNQKNMNNLGKKIDNFDDDDIRDISKDEKKTKIDLNQLNLNSEVFDKLANKNKKNKKAKFL